LSYDEEARVWLKFVRTAEHEARFRDDIFDVDGGFFRLCGDVAACGYHDERVRLAVQVFDVEPPEKDRGGGDNSLTQGQAFAQHRDDYKNICVSWRVGSIGTWNILRFAK
jgi:hypothetical protein